MTILSHATEDRLNTFPEPVEEATIELDNNIPEGAKRLLNNAINNCLGVAFSN